MFFSSPLVAWDGLAGVILAEGCLVMPGFANRPCDGPTPSIEPSPSGWPSLFLSSHCPFR